MTMSWFSHEHYWVPKTDLNTIKDPVKGVIGGLIIEACRCGMVRQIEFKPGEQPIVRMSKLFTNG
jgi:hypothetical protein